MIKFLQIVGARPQFIKIAPLSRAIAEYNRDNGSSIEECIVHTGQHYDKSMSDVFFDELKIPQAHFNLGVGSAGHGEQTAAMLSGIEKIILQVRPAAVIVYGDTNSTIAGALAAAKLHVPVIHIESGLRSFNRRMPEEINRIAVDHISDLLLAPTPTAMENLKREGLAERSKATGDIMYDAVLFNSNLAAQRSRILATLGLEHDRFSMITLHRAENTDNPERLAAILAAFNKLAHDGHKLVFPMHPRTRAAINRFLPKWQAAAGLLLIDPLGYLDMLSLLNATTLVLTDSGGLQKEAFFLQKPCITLRDETEWVETLAGGANRIVGADTDAIYGAAKEILSAVTRPQYNRDVFGHGNSAKETLHVILDFLANRQAISSDNQTDR